MWHWLLHIVPKHIVEQGDQAVQQYHQACIDQHIEPDVQYPRKGNPDGTILKSYADFQSEYANNPDSGCISWLDYAAQFANNNDAALDEHGNSRKKENEGSWCWYRYRSGPLRHIRDLTQEQKRFTHLVDHENILTNFDAPQWRTTLETTVHHAEDQGDSFIIVELPGM